MVQRITYRRRLSYNTPRNKIRKIRTPGSRIVAQYVKKNGHGPHSPHDSC
jgi:large subunit ribosomal protein L34e